MPQILKLAAYQSKAKNMKFQTDSELGPGKIFFFVFTCLSVTANCIFVLMFPFPGAGHTILLYAKYFVYVLCNVTFKMFAKSQQCTYKCLPDILSSVAGADG